MFQDIKKHMKGDHRSVAKEFKNTHEDRFSPRLEDIYWSNPNSSRGTIARCTKEPSEPVIHEPKAVYGEERTTQGI